MKRFLLLGLAACGKIALAPDASVDSQLADAVSCTANELACDGTCIDPMSSNDDCGECGFSCTGQTSCSVGHCVDYTSSCRAIHLAKPASQSGFYTLLSGSRVYCDMENNSDTAYSALSWDNFNHVRTDYTMMTLADFTTVGTQNAFIALYNDVMGNVPVLDTPMDGVGNCAVKVSATANMTLHLGTYQVIPATAAASACAASMGAASYGIDVLAPTPYFPQATIPADFFTTYPPTESAGNDGANPAFWWKKVAP